MMATGGVASKPPKQPRNILLWSEFLIQQEGRGLMYQNGIGLHAWGNQMDPG
jgi:hypothetical protein